MEEGGESEGADSLIFKDLLGVDTSEGGLIKERKAAIKKNLRQLGVSHIHSNEELLKNSAAEKAKVCVLFFSLCLPCCICPSVCTGSRRCSSFLPHLWSALLA